VQSAVRVIEVGYAQVRFPEGWRSPEGRLQRFLPGIDRAGAGAHASAYCARLERMTVTFGTSAAPETLVVGRQWGHGSGTCDTWAARARRDCWANAGATVDDALD
jgi:hypothetical protein